MVRGVSYLGLVLFFFVYGPRQGQGQLNRKKIEKGQTPVFWLNKLSQQMIYYKEMIDDFLFFSYWTNVENPANQDTGSRWQNLLKGERSLVNFNWMMTYCGFFLSLQSNFLGRSKLFWLHILPTTNRKWKRSNIITTTNKLKKLSVRTLFFL